MARQVRKTIYVPQLSTKEKLKLIKKDKKQKLKQKRARLIVRNLPFEANEETLRKHFEKFGELEDVKILKKEDGKLVGCGFIQYKLVQKAAKARHHLNGKPFMGRTINVDFALSREKFENAQKVKIKQENKVKIKEELVYADEIQEAVIEIKSKSEDIKGDKGEEDTEISDEEGESEDKDIEESDEEEEEEESSDEPSVKKPKFESNDVVEGRTVFIKNVPFSATNDDLKECMKQFGPIYYALICVDKFTEHSKGTAFVKFCNAEDAEKALTAGTELTLLGNVLDCQRSLAGNEVREKTSAKKQDKTVTKDSRNLYLVKEGVILVGSQAAEKVSASDMAKRLQLEQYKTQMLRNLNMFVSRERLIVHNLPASWDDNKLRDLIKNNSPKNSFIKEARVMRDMRTVDASGVGKSKEFGFVTFAKHEDAIATLRALNNNPYIFSAHRRPIVAFSIENRAMVKAKQKRLEKSRLNNPKCKNFDINVKKTHDEKKQKR
ncbi:hypothetical protein Zmor_010646 [Zophobas morio]|uniref:RRM domain-containing protein n=1 Tax=Zophobas morio TaxID=2755281 RepID=A0AA38IJE5_9CUCU|nr:hypothetical protein Zmor_010646 [Zophobas morio]